MTGHWYTSPMNGLAGRGFWSTWVCYPIAQCVDGEGFARRAAAKRGKVMGCEPSCGGKGMAFTPEQRPQRPSRRSGQSGAAPNRGCVALAPSRGAVSLATRGAEWARRARHPPRQTRWYRGIQPSLGKFRARGRFFVTENGHRRRSQPQNGDCPQIGVAVGAACMGKGRYESD